MKYQGRIICIGYSLLILLLLYALGGKAWATPNRDLVQAIQEKNIEGVRQALENGADANVQDEGQGKLSYKYKLDVATNRMYALWMVISLAVEGMFTNGIQPLGFGVIFSFKVAAVESLLQPDVFPGLPPLLMAMQHQDHTGRELVELLVQSGADVNAIVPAEHFDGFEKWWTALIAAAYHDDSAMATLLLHHGADVNVIVSEGLHAGDSALLMATARHNSDMIALFTQAGAKPLNTDQHAKAYRMRKEFALQFKRCDGMPGGCLNVHDASYELYTFIDEHRHFPFVLPKEAKHIDVFRFVPLMFGDTNYDFAQANVEPANIDLKNLVVECLRSNSDEAILIENAPFSLEGFYQIFGLPGTIPQWWNDGNAMRDFTLNVVLFGNNNQYGDGQGYGFGCWAFYNERTQMLRMFWWSKQYLSVKRFCNAFQIETCKDEE